MALSFRFFGGDRIEGVLELSERYWYFFLSGHNHLDLRKAVFPQDQPVRINSFCIFGRNKVLVPEGTTVELGGLALIGGNRLNVSPAEEEVHNRLKVKHFCLIGGTRVRSEPKEF